MQQEYGKIPRRENYYVKDILDLQCVLGRVYYDDQASLDIVNCKAEVRRTSSILMSYAKFNSFKDNRPDLI